jgi:hypothetical protein
MRSRIMMVTMTTVTASADMPMRMAHADVVVGDGANHVGIGGEGRRWST